METQIDPKLSSFFAGLNSSLNSIKEVQKLYDPVMAFGFSSFDFIWANEPMISKLLAYFLDPQKPHGQGDIFLRLFLEAIKDKRALDLLDRKMSVSVDAEQHTGDGYVDIVLYWGREYAIGIENKCWGAHDQNRQLERYANHLRRITNGEHNYKLYYLTAAEKDPWEGSLGKDTMADLAENACYQNITFIQHVIPLVKSWAMHCQAHRVQVFLNDFGQYLRTHFLNEKFMNQQDQIVKHVLGSRDSIGIALDVASAIEEIKKALFAKFKEHLVQLAALDGYLFVNEQDNTTAKQCYFEGNFDYQKSSGGSCFCVKDIRWNNLVIAFGFDDGKWLESPFFGISIEGTLSQEIIAYIKESFQGESDEQWPHFQWYKTDQLGNAEFSKISTSLSDDALAKEIYGLLAELADRVNAMPGLLKN